MPSRLVVVTQLTRRAPGSGSDETVSLARELVGLLAELRRPGRHLAPIEIRDARRIGVVRADDMSKRRAGVNTRKVGLAVRHTLLPGK